MHHDPNNPMAHDDKAMKEEAEQAQHEDHRKDPNLCTPKNLQHGNTFRPEGE